MCAYEGILTSIDTISSMTSLIFRGASWIRSTLPLREQRVCSLASMMQAWLESLRSVSSMQSGLVRRLYDQGSSRAGANHTHQTTLYHVSGHSTTFFASVLWESKQRYRL